MSSKETFRYWKAMVHEMSNKEDVIAFARSVLLDTGLDVDIVNVKEEGVSIQAFKKLVMALFEAGYKEGLTQVQSLRGEKDRLEMEGRIMNKHQRTAAYISSKNLVNKKI